MSGVHWLKVRYFFNGINENKTVFKWVHKLGEKIGTLLSKFISALNFPQ